MSFEEVLSQKISVPDFMRDHIMNLVKTGSDFHGVSGVIDSIGVQFNSWLSSQIDHEVELKSSWLNVISFTGAFNEFSWHNELGEGGGQLHQGQYVGVLWIDGDTDEGGNTEIMLPSADIVNCNFEPGRLTVFPISYLHRVNHYSGKAARISLNFTFNIRRKDD